MPYYIIACHKEGQDEDQVQNTIAQNVVKERNMVIGPCFPLTNDKVSKSFLFSSTNLYLLHQVKKTEFKIGSLDQLMELMDTFQKYETQLDASCKRNEKLFFELREELKSEMDLDIDMGF